MRIPFAWLTEQTNDDGSKTLVGFLGDAKVIVEPTGQTSRAGNPTWRMSLAPSPRTTSPNVGHAQRRVRERRADAAGAAE